MTSTKNSGYESEGIKRGLINPEGSGQAVEGREANNLTTTKQI